MLVSLLLLTASLLPSGPVPTAPLEAPNPLATPCVELHVPGTPPPAPRRQRDTPPAIKDKPLPPV